MRAWGKIVCLSLGLSAAVALGALLVFAEETRTSPPPGEVRQVQALAVEFRVPEGAIQGLRDQKMGWGEIAHLLVISKASGQSIDAVLQLRKSGMGWGKIVQTYNLNPGHIRREVRRTERSIRHVHEREMVLRREDLEKDRRAEERMETGSQAELRKPERRERPISWR